MSRASDDARKVSDCSDSRTLARTRSPRRQAAGRPRMEAAPGLHQSVSSLLTVRQVAERYPAFSEAAIRWALYCAKAPQGTRAHEIYAGLRPAVVRVGRRVLIDEPRFVNWVRGAVQ